MTASRQANTSCNKIRAFDRIIITAKANAFFLCCGHICVTLQNRKACMFSLYKNMQARARVISYISYAIVFCRQRFCSKISRQIRAFSMRKTAGKIFSLRYLCTANSEHTANIKGARLFVSSPAPLPMAAQITAPANGIRYYSLAAVNLRISSYSAVRFESHASLFAASSYGSQTYCVCSCDKVISPSHAKPKQYSGTTNVPFGQLALCSCEKILTGIKLCDVSAIKFLTRTPLSSKTSRRAASAGVSLSSPPPEINCHWL